MFSSRRNTNSVIQFRSEHFGRLAAKLILLLSKIVIDSCLIVSMALDVHFCFFRMKYEDRKDFRKDISSPILKDPISKNDQDVVKVLLELPKSSSQGLNNGDKGRDLIQFDLHATLGLFAINEEISKKYNVDMDKHDLLLVLNTGENQKHKRYDSSSFLKTGSCCRRIRKSSSIKS